MTEQEIRYDKRQEDSNPVSTLSFEEMYDLFATDVLRVTYYYLGDRHKAEDITQEVFVKLLTSHPSLAAGHEKAWLLKVALNKCRDHWRGAWIKKIVLGHPAFELFPAPDQYETIADSEMLAQAVNKLPAQFKEVVLLYYYQNYSITEISEMLDLPEGTVSSRLNRGRKRIEDELKGDVRQ